MSRDHSESDLRRARRYTEADYQEMRRNLYPADHGASVAAAERNEAGCAGKETRDELNPPPPNLEGK
jgi:hypothetical protein